MAALGAPIAPAALPEPSAGGTSPRVRHRLGQSPIDRILERLDTMPPSWALWFTIAIAGGAAILAVASAALGAAAGIILSAALATPHRSIEVLAVAAGIVGVVRLWRDAKGGLSIQRAGVVASDALLAAAAVALAAGMRP